LTKSLFDVELRPPKVHVATVRYGSGHEAVVNDRWVYRGHGLYAGYDTRQVFKADYSDGLFSYLSPWHVKGRYGKLPMRLRDYIKLLFAPSFTRLVPKPMHPLARLVSQLPAPERVRHFQRLEQLGAFK
jgi:hypothetical protein